VQKAEVKDLLLRYVFGKTDWYADLYTQFYVAVSGKISFLSK